MNKETSLYYSYADYLREQYGQKVYKLPVNLPVTCPNRASGEGCSFCAGKGTGFEACGPDVSVADQLRQTREKIEKRYKAHKFIAYFQNYTNTFLPLSRLLSYMEEAAGVEDVVEIAISTRPDCISDAYLEALAGFREEHGIRICLEYGLQTVNYHTLKKIRRGHGLAEFIDAVLRTDRWQLPVCAHMILNLPGDSMEDVEESARILSALPLKMVKVHSLYIPEDSPMAGDYLMGKLAICSKEEYLERLAAFIALLRPDIVVERLFSRIPEEDAVFCNWGCSWWKLMDEWTDLMTRKGLRQGSLCAYLNGPALKRMDKE